MDNPAGLLRFWLHEQLNNMDHARALFEAAAEVIKADHDTLAGRMEVLQFGARLADLCVEVRFEVGQLPPELLPDLLLADFEQVEKAVDYFTLARQQTLDNALNQINPAGWRGLEVMDNYLHIHRAERQIDEQTRASLIEQVRVLIDGITQDPDLSVEVKRVVLDRLGEVETALRDALLTGTVAIERATESLIGSWQNPTKRDLWQRVGDSKWGERIGHIAVALCLALGAAADGIAIMQATNSPIPIEYNVTIVNNDGDGVPGAETSNPGPEVIDTFVDDEGEAS